MMSFSCLCACKWFGIEIYGDFYFQNRIHYSVEIKININNQFNGGKIFTSIKLNTNMNSRSCWWTLGWIKKYISRYWEKTVLFDWNNCDVWQIFSGFRAYWVVEGSLAKVTLLKWSVLMSNVDVVQGSCRPDIGNILMFQLWFWP